MKDYAMGVDFGSTTGKTAILDRNGKLVAACIASMGAVSGEGVQASISGALKQAGISQDDIGFCVTTGYGRRMLDISQKSYTEITCHARGAVSLVPEARLVIDIGGQDSKVIAVDANGLVETFAMNDRCAAGTGKFLEVLARAVDVDLEKMGGVALGASQELKISSMCATFAETEVISLLAEGHSKPDVLGAVHAAIAARTAGLVGRVGKRLPVVMTGGVAKNVAAVHHIEKALNTKLTLPEDPQIAGALGAALFALDEIRAAFKKASVNIDEDDRHLDAAVGDARACGTAACKAPAATSLVDVASAGVTTTPLKSRQQLQAQLTAK
ncbi:MAG: (R)-2-hydroxyacyl-CoA dehydratese activating ATPase [Gammaproteobacteria bacterium]|jgi:predicted CoA-substrate-specific enzyme activase|nr:(R)-2-hydroxyacyl-CoA dehydratese activating ATPase [Gammaproteobacteria bacterium]